MYLLDGGFDGSDSNDSNDDDDPVNKDIDIDDNIKIWMRYLFCNNICFN